MENQNQDPVYRKLRLGPSRGWDRAAFISRSGFWESSGLSSARRFAVTLSYERERQLGADMLPRQADRAAGLGHPAESPSAAGNIRVKVAPRPGAPVTVMWP